MKSKNIFQRGLVKEKLPFGTDKLLKLDVINYKKYFFNWIEENYSFYRESYKTLFEYLQLNRMSDPYYVKNLKSKNNLHPDIIELLTAHNRLYS